MLWDLPVWGCFFYIRQQDSIQNQLFTSKNSYAIEDDLLPVLPQVFWSKGYYFFSVCVITGDVTFLIFSLGLETIWFKIQKIRSPEFYQQGLTIRLVSGAQNSISRWISRSRSIGRMLMRYLTHKISAALLITSTLPDLCTLVNHNWVSKEGCNTVLRGGCG